MLRRRRLDYIDGTVLTIQQRSVLGPPSAVTRDCNGAQEQSTGVNAPSGVFLCDCREGKREFRCPRTALFSSDDDPLLELWKTLDKRLPVLGGGGYAYSPYYMVLSPARYYIDGWQSLQGVTGPAVQMVNLGYQDTAGFAAVSEPAGNGAIPDMCAVLPAAQEAVPREDRWLSPLSLFVGDTSWGVPKHSADLKLEWRVQGAPGEFQFQLRDGLADLP